MVDELLAKLNAELGKLGHRGASAGRARLDQLPEGTADRRARRGHCAVAVLPV